MKYKEQFEYDPYFLIGEKRGMEKGMEKGMEEGMEKGLSVGKEKGQALKDIIAIRNMLAKNFDLTTIAEILEVPQEHVLEIKNQLAKEPQIVASLRKQSNVDFEKIGAALSVSPLLVEVLKKEHGL